MKSEMLDKAYNEAKNHKEMNIKEAEHAFNELKRNREIIDTIDKNFFFMFAETVLVDRKRLKEMYNNVSNRNVEITNLYLNSISKDKIKTKIEKLKIDLIGNRVRYPYIVQHKIDVLEELLEGE